MSEAQAELIIECIPSGRNGTATLTVKLAGDVLAVEKLDLAKPKAREAFIARLRDSRPGIDSTTVEAELLRWAADLASKPDRNTVSDVGSLPEIDVSSIIRPERIILPEVSGLAVPTMTLMGDTPVGRWLLCLQWSDGRRQCYPLPKWIDLPEGRRVWIHPEPAAPTAATAPGWSPGSRKAWLAGAAAPSPGDVFNAVYDRIEHFVELPREHAPGVTSTLALWTLLTYCYSAWPAVPYLFVGGPLGSGKSRVFEIMSRLAFRAFPSSNMTAATLFRTLHDRGGVLLLDEAERLKQTQSPEVGELLNMLLAGYKRGGQANRLEPVGDKGFTTIGFDVFGPKALACIAGLPPPLASRCIPVTMFRAGPTSPKPRRSIDAEPERWQQLRDDLHLLSLEHGRTWLELPGRTDVCPAMSGRDFELWQPLLALAAWIESHGVPNLLPIMQDHALATIDHGRDEAVPDADETLLHVVAEAMRTGEWLTPHEILEKAARMEPAVFKNWYPRTVSARLKSYGVPTPRKIGSRREYRDVTSELLRRIQTNYGIDLGFPKPEPPTPLALSV